MTIRTWKTLKGFRNMGIYYDRVVNCIEIELWFWTILICLEKK